MLGFAGLPSTGFGPRSRPRTCCHASRREFLLAGLSTFVTLKPVLADDELPPEKQKALDDFKMVTRLQDEAFQLTQQMNYKKAETIWTQIIGLNDTNAAAFSNRGNCRTSQGRFDEAIGDFDTAIKLAPDEPDPYLGKGVAQEGLKDFNAALRNYEIANEKSMSRYGIDDPVTYNNRGNAYAGLGNWEQAVELYQKAADMNRGYVFARANEALARYELGQTSKSLSIMRFLERKYPGFADVHAALAAAYWAEGNRSAAESEWSNTLELDTRYKDIVWIEDFRRWPPRLVNDMKRFRSLQK